MRILRMTRDDAAFYETIGPFLSRREFVAELGGPIWDDDGKVWFVAKRGRATLGIAAYRRVGNRTALVSAYVLPNHRRSGAYTALIEARLNELSGRVTATATDASRPALRKFGFRQIGKRGRFAIMEKDCG